MVCLRIFVVSAFCAFAVLPAAGQVTFLDPIPYLSVADSPFDFAGLGSTFFFEDFEDGDFDLPPGVTTFQHVLHSPSAITDSVDADDGVIDGFGRDGYTLRPDVGHVLNTNPPTWVQIFNLTFDGSVLGSLPDHFGFAWTDGLPQGGVNFVVRFEDGTASRREYRFLMDEFDSGETLEDRYLGVSSDRPFRSVSVNYFFESYVFVDRFEMDHVQFGWAVPEPNYPSLTFWILIVSAHFVAGRISLREMLPREAGHESRKLGGGQAKYVIFGHGRICFA